MDMYHNSNTCIFPYNDHAHKTAADSLPLNLRISYKALESVRTMYSWVLLSLDFMPELFPAVRGFRLYSRVHTVYVIVFHWNQLVEYLL